MSDDLLQSMDFDPASLDGAAVFGWDGKRLKGIEASKLVPYNFRDPGSLSHAEMEWLSAQHQRLVQGLSARLSTYLRLECVLKVTRFVSTTFQRFLETLAPSTHLTLFQADPLRGVCLVELGPKASFAMADRLLGGKGRAGRTDRQLSEIELTLLEDVVQLIIGEWAHLWQDGEWGVTPQIVGHESSGRFVQTSPPDAVFLALSVELAIGETTDLVQMGIPFSALEQVVKRLHRAKKGEKPALPRKMQWRQPYTEIPVAITAEWPVREIALQEAIALQVGDVIELPREVVAQTQVCLSGSLEYLGTIGVQEGKIAVHITDKIVKYT